MWIPDVNGLKSLSSFEKLKKIIWQPAYSEDRSKDGNENDNRLVGTGGGMRE